MGEPDKFSGLIYCADCGQRHYFCRGRTIDPKIFSYICGTYHAHKHPCTPHSIRIGDLEQIVSAHIRFVMGFANDYAKEFARMLMSKSAKEQERLLRKMEQELGKAKERSQILNSRFVQIYEDKCDGKLTEERFLTLSNSFEMEQAELVTTIQSLEKDLSEQKEKTIQVESFLKLVKRYLQFEKLDAAMLNELIDKIVIHEKTKVDGQKQQQIDIYYNFVGLVEFPDDSCEHKKVAESA